MTQVKVTKEQVEFIVQNCNRFKVGNEQWYYLPFWIKRTDTDTVEMISFEKLPESVKEGFQRLREAKRRGQIKQKTYKYPR